MAPTPSRRKTDPLLNGKRLTLLYQPIFSVDTLQMVSAEALLRVPDGSGGTRGAGDVVEEAEEGNDIFALQERVTWSALHDAARWQSEGAETLRLNLNLSARQLCDPHLAQELEDVMDENEVPASLLNLEITETSYIEEPKKVIPLLERLRARGLQLWLDDFGSGHSSLGHLRDFPINGLKLPGSFITRLCEHDRSRSIVRSVIALAHELKAQVVAEEVERQAQFDELKRIGCDYIQGFLLSKPLPVDELIRRAREETFAR